MQNATLEIKWDEQSQNMLFIITTKEYSDQAIIDDSFECELKIMYLRSINAESSQYFQVSFGKYSNPVFGINLNTRAITFTESYFLKFFYQLNFEKFLL